MKKLFTLFAVAIITATTFAQVPEKLSYQSVVRNAKGDLVTSHSVGMRISILHGSVSDSAVYVETQTPTINANGLVTIEIGSGIHVKGAFDSIDWANGPFFIKTETDRDGGTNYTIIGVSQLLSVPYALYAKTSGTVTNVPTPINPNDAANKAYVDELENLIYKNELIKVTDIDGNEYKTVKIGDQIWMKENLKTKHYNNGDSIGTTYPFSRDITLDTLPKYQWAYAGDENNASVYGRLYTWYVVNDSLNVCPVGWHVPSDQEWKLLEMYLGMTQEQADGTYGRGTDEGGKLKEVGISHWWSANIGATNESGFTALAGGNRYYTGASSGLGQLGEFWTSSEEDSTKAWCRRLDYNFATIIRIGDFKNIGFSVRCIKD